MMKVAILLCLVAVAIAVPLPEPEADPSLLLPHGHHYPLYSPFINAIKDDTGVYTYPNGLLAPESRYPFAYGYQGYPAGYPYPLYPYGVKPASEK
ncbi:uncharacterized protein LOC135202693 isoform X2 [Macrobrachium nipponense]|uniref:uncharacterized protein LOC135202693 isoform X2 n=1 Tax=Macrobrachium nipponense TaxID=159736 RepID=UPI0030C878F2